MTSPTPPPDLDPVALEAAARKSYEQKGKRKGINYIGWGEEPDSIKAEWIFDVKEAITAYLTASRTRGEGGAAAMREAAAAVVRRHQDIVGWQPGDNRNGLLQEIEDKILALPLPR